MVHFNRRVNTESEHLLSVSPFQAIFISFYIILNTKELQGGIEVLQQKKTLKKHVYYIYYNFLTLNLNVLNACTMINELYTLLIKRNLLAFHTCSKSHWCCIHCSMQSPPSEFCPIPAAKIASDITDLWDLHECSSPRLSYSKSPRGQASSGLEEAKMYRLGGELNSVVC